MCHNRGYGIFTHEKEQPDEKIDRSRIGGFYDGFNRLRNDPESGNYGTVTPIRDGSTSSGQYCREYQQTVTVGGRTQQAYGTACRQPDGQWKVVQ